MGWSEGNRAMVCRVWMDLGGIRSRITREGLRSGYKVNKEN